jgi:5'(3')-deoxyribonucleotidase
MRTAFLGSYGFGNLGDELCLIEALQAYKTDDAWVFSSRPEYTGRFVSPQGWFKDRKPLEEIKPDRVILGGGGVGFWPSLKDALHWMHDHLIRGAECHIHNIGVGRITQAEWKTDPVVRAVIAQCASFSVRDHVSQWMVQEWGFGRNPSLTFYPERDLPKDDALIDLLPPGPLLGISITGQKVMTDALDRNRQRVQTMLERFRGYKIVPIISVNHPWEPDEDDISGFHRFAERFLRDFEIVMPETLDREWWDSNLTPLRLKGLIAQCDVLISQRKHNLIHAIGAKVPFIAIHPANDDSLVRIIYTLHSKTDPMCGFLSLL